MPPSSAVVQATFEPALRRALPTRAAPIHHDVSPAAQALVDGYRLHGYRRAALDPLQNSPADALTVPELDPRTYRLSFDQSATYVVHFGGALRTFTLLELLSYVQASYCGSIGIDSAHVRSTEQRRWLHQQLESRLALPAVPDNEAVAILERLARAQAFEHFHRANCAGYKQFSLEGSESFVVLLRTVIEKAAQLRVEDVVVGMPHRGRLNIMLNALDVPAAQLMSLFSTTPDPNLAGSDIKDHAGFSRRIACANGDIRVLLARNPSHLESISPVVCGMARALQDRKATGTSDKVLPILVHGDGSFSAQGIVTETLNLSQTRGFGIGGTLHLILNNQIGSTMSHPRDARSTLYGADIARGIDAPVLHVNADDPEAVVLVARLATDYRMKFGSDIVVDQIGYRLFGHFVGDDPTITQPAMQRRIERLRSVPEIYAESLTQRGLPGTEMLDGAKAAAFRLMSAAKAEANRVIAANNAAPHTAATAALASPTLAADQRRVRTAIPVQQLRAIIERLVNAPAGFKLHATVENARESWRAVLRNEDAPVDWRLAENLAFATALANGYNVRLSGLDVGRGTFMHRQHVWHDQATEGDWQRVHVPLRHVADEQGAFSIFESPISEEAVLGFEYGYSLQCNRDLVLWEAQFGDFVNNGQVIIDQFIASGESKWNYQSGLVLMLPHGYDGWGPEHSSAYLGRFLQLCAEGNMRIAMPSTAAQVFHLLRRQALMSERKPLVVMTPKPAFYACMASYSRLNDLATGGFQALIGDPSVDALRVVRAVVSSGKVYYDVAAERDQRALKNVALLRAEELYPFPVSALEETLARYPSLREVVWAQEETKNQGAWHLVREHLEAALPQGVTLRYAGRPAAAVSASCNPARHAAERQQLVSDAFSRPA